MGTPQFAIPTLDALITAGHEITAVYTRPPAFSGRGRKLVLSPVHARADELRLPVFTPASLKDPEVVQEFEAHDVDLAIVAAYGHILPRSFLTRPRLGCLNVHASLLPRWRGAAPIQRAILAGDEESGITIIRMDAGMDTGDILAECKHPIKGMTSGEVHHDLSLIGAGLMSHVIENISSLLAAPQSNDDAIMAAKITKDEARIDFNRPALEIERKVRAFNPAPGAWTMIAGERIKIHKCEIVAASGRPGAVLDNRLTIACGTGAVRPTVLQRPGRTTCSGIELAHAMKIETGQMVDSLTSRKNEHLAQAACRQ